MKTKVQNMLSSRGGHNRVANQFIISSGDALVFQSYQTVIARKDSTGITLDRDMWDYSATTSKYRNQFLGETTKETQARIDSGEYKLADLNA